MKIGLMNFVISPIYYRTEIIKYGIKLKKPLIELTQLMASSLIITTIFELLVC